MDVYIHAEIYIHSYFFKNEIADRRVALTAILVDLLEQQKTRRDQLMKTINTIEQQRCDSVIIYHIFNF
jgi:ribosomal protein L16 Arg81 hydroxylase